ncbi:hypothetical protein [Parasedimentitalea psychrophila]|uniref:Tetratricopeptide repeat-like domain-containing protein n=1 Tax=Parasedimentitalea psychrophila TaxID=2997337 RepID=A0A9Y2KXK5_9RHOB|nr:hypothetical protein [Parasedimentitalea psychrophila]WIY23587.1 hypothetical protein QPJ95_13065 [Parasedimentitalea psychrophila]
MSDTDSFIDEVTEEVRRDRMFLMMKRYGWIGAVVVVAIVGGAAYREYEQSRTSAAAESLGDAVIAALAENEPDQRSAALATIAAKTPGGDAILKMLQAGALANSEQADAAVTLLGEISTNGDLPLIYRHIATFKALGLQQDSLSAQDRRMQYETLAQPGAPLRLLAQEQMALIDIADGDTDAAIARLRAIIEDAEVSADLQDRARQVIVALGGTLDLPAATQG